MFAHLRRARSMLMGLAILGIAYYHAPFILHGTWTRLFHNCLYCGVDVFLLLSGIGAVHSIEKRGGRDYLRQRALRLLPGLLPMLLLWCVLMTALGFMGPWSFLGSMTLLGWWLGDPVQLNWYFSAVWMFFLLAVPVSALFRRWDHPWLLWLGLLILSAVIGVLCPLDYLMTALTRLPVFFTGMLFGTLEKRGFARTGLLRGALILLFLLGFRLVEYVFWGDGGRVYGYSLGFWWYVFLPVIPGAAVLIGDLHGLLSRWKLARVILRPVEWCGESSAEILMLHVGTYKIINGLTTFRNRIWVLILLGCCALGCLYHYLAVEPLTKRLEQRLRKSKASSDI